MSRRVRYLSFERLSEEGQGVVLRLIDEDVTQRQIQAALLAETGETISNGGLGRFVQNWRRVRDIERNSAKQTERLIAALKSSDADSTIVDAATAIVQQGMVANADEIEEYGLGEYLKLATRLGELQVKQKGLEIKQRRLDGLERELAIKEEQAAAQRARMAAAAEKAQALEKAVSGVKGLPLEVVGNIREMYGLLREAA